MKSTTKLKYPVLAKFAKQFSLKTPCKNCPFIKADKGQPFNHLSPGRMTSIIDNMTKGTFHCHKTTDKPRDERKHCAGAIALSLKKNEFTAVHALAVGYGFVDPDYYDKALELTIEPEDLT